MKTYYRLAKKDCRIVHEGPDGGVLEFKRGDKVLTSEARPDGMVTVLRGCLWGNLYLEEYFSGEIAAGFILRV